MSKFVKSTLPGWEDVVRTPQDDGDNPVVAIAYPEDFRHLMDLFRTILVTKEYSQRVLQLTMDILERNAGNYTVWQYRRECLLALNVDLQKELDYLDTYADENPKNYQIWFHRRMIVEACNDPTRERQFTADVIENDSKNYHAWSHRQWVLRTFGNRPQYAGTWWDEELQFLDDLVVIDVRNNSAWNQRWFVVHHRPYDSVSDSAAVDEPQRPVTVPRAALLAEVAYTTKCIGKATLNESAWNYLRALWSHHAEEPNKGQEQAQSQGQAQMQAEGPDVWLLVERFCEGMAANKEHAKNSFLFSLLAEIRERQSSKGTDDPAEQRALRLQAQQHYLHLAKVDQLRIKYWRVRAAEVTAGLSGCDAEVAAASDSSSS